jgi:RNA-directed DNA polymerase
MNQSVSLLPALDEQAALEFPETDLMERVVSRGNMTEAWNRVRSNRGAAGVDGMEVEAFPAFVRDQWEKIRSQLLDGSYRPSPVRRVAIPKPDGGERMLGIPTVLDRVIQQAVAQVLTPRFDPTFSESSFGFRPGRKAHDAVRHARLMAWKKRAWVVDLDLEKFFDRVQHDVLMNRVSRRVIDKRVLSLIGRWLRAGVMVGGLFERTEEGTPQGGPLSPLLANILLDDLDKELERRGLPFARYADDLMIFCRSRMAADRVKYKITKYLEKELRLRVNERKSQIAPLWKCSFLGFTFDRIRWRGRWRGLAVQVALSGKTLERIKRKVRDLTGRSQGVAWKRRIEDLNRVLRGWVNYFGLIGVSTALGELDEWIRRRLRMCLWKQWRLGKTRVRELLARGVPRARALETGYTQKGYWRISKSPALHAALTNEWLRKEGLVSLKASWKELEHLRRTAGCETRTSGGVGAGG